MYSTYAGNNYFISKILHHEWLSQLTNSLKTRDRRTGGEERLDHLAILCFESDFAKKVEFSAKKNCDKFSLAIVKNYAR